MNVEAKLVQYDKVSRLAERLCKQILEYPGLPRIAFGELAMEIQEAITELESTEVTGAR